MDPHDYTMDEWAKVAAENGRDSCIPEFYMNAKKNKAKSAEAGRAVHENVAYVRIHIPGDRNNTPDRPVKDEDKQRWPDQWKKFELLGESAPEGTPLEEWAYLDKAKVYDLKAQNIHTIEQVSELDDGAITRMGHGARDMVKKAKLHLKPPTAKIKDLNATILEMQNQISALQSENRQLRGDTEGEVA